MDLIVEPMCFDRIDYLGNSSTMKARLQEELRLVELAQGTRVRYTGMGGFSAGAGNHSSTIHNKSPTGSPSPAVHLEMTRTNGPWTHTSDDSYMHQLSLVVAIASIYF